VCAAAADHLPTRRRWVVVHVPPSAIGDQIVGIKVDAAEPADVDRQGDLAERTTTSPTDIDGHS